MRKVKCPVCEHTKRPYGFPRTDKPRPTQPHQMEYKPGTYSIKCSDCGAELFVRLDYIPELAPVDIAECWASDGTPGEVVDEKRGGERHKEVSEIAEVDPDNVTRPAKKSKRSGNGK